MSTFHIAIENLESLDPAKGVAWAVLVCLDDVQEVPKGQTRMLPFDGKRIVYNHGFKLPAVMGNLLFRLENQSHETISEFYYSTKNIDRKRTVNRFEMIPFGLLQIKTQLVAPPARSPTQALIKVHKMKYLIPDRFTAFLTLYLDQNLCVGVTKPVKSTSDCIDWESEFRVPYSGQQFLNLHLTEKRRIHKDEIVGMGQHNLWTEFDSDDATPNVRLEVTIASAQQQVARCLVYIVFSD